MKPPNAKHLLKYFDTSGTDPITLAPHLGWEDTTPLPLGSPENKGYGPSVDPPKPYYFGPFAPSTEELARVAASFGDRITDLRMGYFSREVVCGKDGDTGEGGERATRTLTGETYLAVRVLDHVASGGVCRVVFVREAT